ncbi:hypothetical protein DFR58_103130 [Anaerobacterium chartisolvens]|uniref:Uncharacterized protein n=1 Tax=Anaerobacterium chartisolvens TaxID=1297424 RepID=A0A369BDT1_9FIRM|nr:hypothetical protein [Anaerobacterium chartisolvens]RCX19385.1 hypothetical protein DFR58_103130 [Anaerobacterium chartisolvens]
MTDQQKIEIIKGYIDDIDAFIRNPQLSLDQKQHMERAYAVYNDIYRDVQRGKIDPDELHENLSGFFYMLQ